MSQAEIFVEHVEQVCRRRHMFVPGGSFYEVCAYFSGFAAASTDCPLSGKGWTSFNAFVCATFAFPSKYGWAYVLKQCSRDDDEATARLQSVLTEFAERTKTQSHEEIVQDALAQASQRAETEPVKAWRKFSRAIHRASRTEIESLIQSHPDADVLWSATYPDDVVPLMDQIAESYPVSQISGSVDDGEVTIITPDFGPVRVKRVGNRWRIDASQIINCWDANGHKAE